MKRWAPQPQSAPTQTATCCRHRQPARQELPRLLLLREHALGGGDGACAARVGLARVAQRARKGLEGRLHDVVAVLARQLSVWSGGGRGGWHAGARRPARLTPHHTDSGWLFCSRRRCHALPPCAALHAPGGGAASCRWCWPGSGKSAPPAASRTSQCAPWAAPGRSWGVGREARG